MLSYKKWMPIAIAAICLQIGLEGFAVGRILLQNMLPQKYAAAVVIAAVLSVLLTAALLLIGRKKDPRRRWLRCVRRVIGIILVLGFGFGSLYASNMMSEMKSAINNVTENSNEVRAMMGVYVMADDPAQTMSDAKDYTFSVMQDYDQENTEYAIQYIGNETGTEPATVGKSDAQAAAAALYSGEADALILNESYVAILEETDEYASFESDTRRIYEFPITVSANVMDQSEDEESADTTVDDVTQDPFLVYVSGSDTRSTILTTSRSDVNILMAVNPQTKQIFLLNTPRDYYIDNPAGGGAKDKLTHCGIYGVDNSIAALEELYSTNVNYYIQMNFSGFETLIDDIGGITVTSPQAFTVGNFSFQEGENEVNGEQALAFARERYSFSGGDNQRGQNQMEVITAVIDKITSGTTFLQNYTDILDSLSDMFATDLSSDEISSLVRMQLDDNAHWTILSYAVTGTGGTETTYSMPASTAYVMYPNESTVQKAASLLRRFLSGEQLSDADVAS